MYNPPRRDNWSFHYPYADRFVSLYSDGHAEAMLTEIPLAKLSNCPYEPLTSEKWWWAEGFYDAMKDRYAEYREKNPAKYSPSTEAYLYSQVGEITKRIGDLLTNV